MNASSVKVPVEQRQVDEVAHYLPEGFLLCLLRGLGLLSALSIT